MMRKMLLVIIGSVVLSTVFSSAAFAGWIEERGRWRYSQEDGSYIQSKWKRIDDKWYYFDSSGYMKTGWVAANNTWYYCDPQSGAMLLDETREIDGVRYTFGGNGKLYSSEKAMAADPVPECEEKANLTRWFNASYAIYTEYSGGDVTVFGGRERSFGYGSSCNFVRLLLKNSWGVTDRNSAQGALKSMTDMAGMTGSGWDYGRAMQLASWYYIADFYTEKEAYENCLLIAESMQKRFGSWDEFAESYLEGYSQWSGGDSRRGYYDKLKAMQDSPYAVDWNMELSKCW